MIVAPLLRGATLHQRIMEYLRRQYRDFGAAPSINQIAIAVGASRQSICRALNRLEAGGLINRRPGQAHSITLPSRTAMLSDAELEMEARTRGMTLTTPSAAAAPLAQAYPWKPVQFANSRSPRSSPISRPRRQEANMAKTKASNIGLGRLTKPRGGARAQPPATRRASPLEPTPEQRARVEYLRGEVRDEGRWVGLAWRRRPLVESLADKIGLGPAELAALRYYRNAYERADSSLTKSCLDVGPGGGGGQRAGRASARRNRGGHRRTLDGAAL